MIQTITETKQKKKVLKFIEQHLLTYGTYKGENYALVSLDFDQYDKGFHKFIVHVSGKVKQIS